LFIILTSSLFLSWSFLPKLCLILETIFCCNSFVLELFSKNFYLKGKGKTILFKAKESKTKLEKEREPSKLIAIIL
jgi:preprotein translocase subunit SecG